MAQSIANDEEFLSLLPSKWWKSFFKKFDEIDTLPNSSWKQVHQLAHLTKRYEETYGKRFSFSLRGQPAKCPEIHMINRVSAVLGTSNQRTIRTYIDWVFDKKIVPSGKRIRSIGFFANPSFCNEFHLHVAERGKITRSSNLPCDYIEVIDALDLPMRTFGDLAFAKQAVDENPNSKSREPYRVMFKKLYAIGFEFDMLKEIK